MATKTFKIGLSNTDKQNMAQDVYERLLALTFPEYDSAESYDVGDFVVYNDQLYKCIGATTGAWDSTKWQLATLNDLVTDIENAVAFVNDKANVDGNYPTMTVGFADNLTPYSEESGDDQEEPFSFQATGTGNGTQEDFATGSAALMKEKRGNTVVVNNGAKELNGTNWYTGDASVSFSDGVATFTASAQYGNIHTSYNLNGINGHKYLIVASIKLTTATTDVRVRIFAGYKDVNTQATTNWQFLCGIGTLLETLNAPIFVSDNRTSGWDAIQVKGVYCIDLTQWFNGDIPQDLLDNPSNFFRYYQGSLAYNTGELVNANGRYLKAIGRNQWDEDVENGYIDDATGENVGSQTQYLRSKNYIRVIPNATYYFFISHAGKVYFYDKDKNYIKWENSISNGTFTIPSNACYMRFWCNYDGTYANDITISIYYEGEGGYDQYYPYEVLTNNDTGTEVLRSAGSVFDSKAPDGTVTRRIASVDLSTLTWSYNYTYLCWRAYLDDIKNNANAISDKYNCVKNTDGENLNVGDLTTYWQWWGSSGQIAIRSDDSSNTPTGTLFYELATPTTEQGTPYSENIAIDDFGSMDFSGTSGVPQCNLIFYPVDYKAFIDTLYNYTEGTPSNIALKSDLTGLVAQEDLSDDITISASLTKTFGKLYKQGNTIVLSLKLTNNSGASVSANSSIATLPSDVRVTTGKIFKAVVLANDYATISDLAIEMTTAGELSNKEAITDGSIVYIDISYAL